MVLFPDFRFLAFTMIETVRPFRRPSSPRHCQPLSTLLSFAPIHQFVRECSECSMSAIGTLAQGEEGDW